MDQCILNLVLLAQSPELGILAVYLLVVVVSLVNSLIIID